jgi:hypothetical protein
MLPAPTSYRGSAIQSVFSEGVQPQCVLLRRPQATRKAMFALNERADSRESLGHRGINQVGQSKGAGHISLER